MAGREPGKHSAAPVDHDGAGLAETMRTGLRLQVHVRVPAQHMRTSLFEQTE